MRENSVAATPTTTPTYLNRKYMQIKALYFAK
jgi:hypothetical protein